jgi:hypothetical protein
VLDRLTLAAAYHRSSFHLPHHREGLRSRAWNYEVTTYDPDSSNFEPSMSALG